MGVFFCLLTYLGFYFLIFFFTLGFMFTEKHQIPMYFSPSLPGCPRSRCLCCRLLRAPVSRCVRMSQCARSPPPGAPARRLLSMPVFSLEWCLCFGEGHCSLCQAPALYLDPCPLAHCVLVEVPTRCSPPASGRRRGESWVSVFAQ